MCKDCLAKDEYTNIEGIESTSLSYLESLNSRGDI